MKKLIITTNKNPNLHDENTVQINNEDLEFFGHFSHGENFIKIPSLTVSDKTILEWFSIDDFSTWWFASSVIHPKYKEAMVFIDRLLFFINKYNPNTIILQASFDKKNIIEQLCKNNNIQLIISKKEYFLFKVNNKTKTKLKKSFYKKILAEKTKKRLKCFSEYKCQFPNEGYGLIISPGLYRRKNFDPITNKSTQEEFFIKPIMDYFDKEKIPMLCIDVDYTFRGTTQILKERLESTTNWMPIEYLLSDIDNNIKNKLLNLEKSIFELLKNNLDHVFFYKDVSLSNFLKPIIESLFLEPYFPFYFTIIGTFENFLTKNKPSVIVQVYESGPYAKAIEIAAERNGIKTIGIQHGLIPSDYPEYMSREIRSEKTPLGNIIPDSTLVFGSFYEKLLSEKGQYPRTSLTSIGNPAFYDIKNTLEKLSEKKLYDKERDNKKIILVPLSFRLIKKTPDNEILNLLYTLYKNSKSLLILVRLHPGDPTTNDEFKKIYPANNFILSNKSLAEDIFSSDVVTVLPTSTVSTEAILFQKPVIFVNVSDLEVNDVYLHLVENHLAQLVPINKLETTIQSTLCEKYQINRKNWTDFVNNFFNYDNIPDFSKILKS